MSHSFAFIQAIPLPKSRHHAVRRAAFRKLNSHRVHIHPVLCAPSPPSPSPSSSSPNFSSSTQQTSTTPIARTFSAPPLATPASPTDALLESAIELASSWVTEFESSSASNQSNLVANLSTDPSSVAFVMKFTDWVMRPDNSQVAARMFARLLQTDTIPDFLHAIDSFLLKLGGKFAQIFPWPVIFAARLRMQAMVSDFVGAVETLRLSKATMQWNVNLLGEAVLGEEEALKRRLEAEELVARDDVDYVSVKVSGVTSQLNRWDFEGSLERVLNALRPLFRRAATSQPRVLINLDMEEYHDLEITLEAFIKLLDEEEFIDLNAGIVLQTYLPDSFEALKKLVNWANNRSGSAEIKIRLVKGANLAMEKVDAAIHGWEQAPYEAKVETDANYLRCLNWVLTPERTRRVRIGVASHNVFLLAYATALSRSRGVSHRVGFEMLKGMTPTHTPFLAKQGHGMLLYTPVCRMRDFDVAISYLFRRFEEMTATGNFLRSLPNITVKDSATFRMEEARFRAAFAKMNKVATRPRRTQTRPAMASAMTIKGLTGTSQFFNEPNTDPALPETRKWALEVLKDKYYKPSSLEVVESVSRIHEILNRGREAATEWASTTPGERRRMLSKIADVLARRRGDLINAMIHEGRKTFAEADSEVSEAIDFAHYYGMMAENLPQNFKPFGLMCVVAPWNFPVAIVCGGVLSSLAAGNCVVLKPSSLTRRCGQLVAECAWEAGLPADVLQVIGVQGMEPGKELVTGADGVVLTGSSETAKLFKSWKSDIRLFAETSGKNSLIISPAADIDLAVSDLVQSAFSNTGQRCSASSLAICIGDVYTSDRFLRQLKDAVETIVVGPGTDISTVMGPLIKAPRKGEKLYRALTTLEPGETWLVKPKCLDKDDAGEGLIWTPGVKLGVRQGSWFHQNEVFGPVLGVMYAENLQHALALQNGNRYGLTGGLHSLDNTEIENWMEHVNVGNAYVNRGITGAIVQRQPFGGWKDSVIGPGAKAGGVNYVAQFGTIAETEDKVRNEEWLKEALQSDEREWKEHFAKEHDDAALFCEGNIFRYRPLPCIAVRIGQNSNDVEVRRVRAAVERCAGTSTTVLWSKAQDETVDEFVKRLEKLHVRHEIRVRTVGDAEQAVLEKAAQLGVHVAANSVVKNARVELLHYLREQSVSRTRHRFGNLVTG